VVTFEEWLDEHRRELAADSEYHEDDLRAAFEGGRDAERDYLAKGGSFK